MQSFITFGVIFAKSGRRGYLSRKEAAVIKSLFPEIEVFIY